MAARCLVCYTWRPLHDNRNILQCQKCSRLLTRQEYDVYSRETTKELQNKPAKCTCPLCQLRDLMTAACDEGDKQANPTPATPAKSPEIDVVFMRLRSVETKIAYLEKIITDLANGTKPQPVAVGPAPMPPPRPDPVVGAAVMGIDGVARAVPNASD
jgi:hypothetical protein